MASPRSYIGKSSRGRIAKLKPTGMPCEVQRRVLWDLLHRLRVTIPLKVDKVDLFEACLPRSFKTNTEEDQTKVVNMMALLEVQGANIFRFMHRDELFSVRIQNNYTLPQQRGTAWFTVPTEYKYLADLDHWIGEIKLLESSIYLAKDNLRHYLHQGPSAPVVRVTWPELMCYTKFEGGPGHGVSNSELNRLKHTMTLLGAETKEVINEMLAAASLLRHDVVPEAWLGVAVAD